MKHRWTYFCYLILALCLTACAPQAELFTQPHRQRIAKSARMDVERIQYYNDRDIRLVYRSKFEDETITGGRVEFKDGYYVYTIDIKKMTPCVGKKVNERTLEIYFEEGNFLVFKNFNDNPYYLLSGKRHDGVFLVRYEGKWFRPEEGSNARLLFVQDRVLERKENYRRAKGVLVE